MPQRPIELHYWPTPNGCKITIMLEECGLPYEVMPVNIGRGDQFKPEFLAIAPNNRMPAIVDPDGPAASRSRSSSRAPSCSTSGERPASSIRRTSDASRWSSGSSGRWAASAPMSGQAHHFRNYAPEKIPYAIERYTNEVNRLYGVLDKRLADREYLAGDYSIADMAAIRGCGPTSARARTSPSSRPRALVQAHPRSASRGQGCEGRGGAARQGTVWRPTRRRRKFCSARRRASRRAAVARLTPLAYGRDGA